MVSSLEGGNMVKAIVTGACGRMGGRIISLLDETQGIELIGAVERKGHPRIGSDAGEGLGLKTGVIVGDDLMGCIAGGDVVIDFTSHEVSAGHLEIAATMGKAIVIGSTGFTSPKISRTLPRSESPT